VPVTLDIPSMREAADTLLGEHDFSSFCRRPDGDVSVSLVRRILDITVRRDEAGGDEAGADEADVDLVTVEVTGTAFCHQMVRSIVGTLVDVGRGRFRASEVPGMLAARDRAAAGQVAPPHGLTLVEVGYDGERWDGPRA